MVSEFESGINSKYLHWEYGHRVVVQYYHPSVPQWDQRGRRGRLQSEDVVAAVTVRIVDEYLLWEPTCVLLDHINFHNCVQQRKRQRATTAYSVPAMGNLTDNTFLGPVCSVYPDSRTFY